MSLKDKMEQMKFDIRLIDWNLRHGVVKPEEVKKHLEKLNDLTGDVAHFQLDEDSSSDIDDEEPVH